MSGKDAKATARREIEHKLAPEIILENLMLSSLFITAYELLKSSIVDDVRSFFSLPSTNGESVTGPEYKASVLDRDSFLFRASCLWLVDVGAIKREDVDQLQQIREYRNQLAHDLPRLLVDPHVSFDTAKLIKTKHYIDQIGRFWTRTDASTNPDFDGVDVNTIPNSQITSGRMMLVELISNAVIKTLAHGINDATAAITHEARPVTTTH